MIVWLGHAGFFIRLGGIVFITDPVFYNMSFIKRHVGIPCNVEKMRGVDYLLLSHGHRDHFDKKTLKILFALNPDIEALVSMNNSSFFENNGIKFQQAGWYQKYETKNGLEVFFMPAKHWNRRGLFDFNKTLWGSFIVRHKGVTIYFAGDTSMGDHFEEIARMFPAIDFCLLPVGAYKPVRIMQEAHLSPQEAYKAFKILGGKTFIPMHFGTYDLGDEPLGEPQRILEAYADSRIKILKVGEVVKW
ncbi:MAG: MBL fold metallo-hydrolase [Bacteroidales bacterium]|nr:MBL fold metallo-hydrolase [Bacteroidales bacterium]